MRRVVVTGLGVLSPLGRGLDVNKEKLFNGKSGIVKITRFDVSEISSKIAGLIPEGKNKGEFDFDSVVSPKDRRRMDDFIVYGLAAAEDAIKDSGIDIENLSAEEKSRIGTIVGSGVGGLQTIADGAITLKEKGPRRLSPFVIPASLINLASGHISIKYGLTGPNHSIVTACATSTHSIGDAMRIIQHGDADVMFAGGAENAVVPLGVAGFASARALSTEYNDTPEKGSRPWDKGRDGFVIAEGAGILIIEELEHAKKRGAKIYGEVIGYGMSGDANHITAPREDGQGGYMAMKNALKNAGINPEDIDYINAHGTSTPLGDLAEFKAVAKLFDGYHDKISMSSTKSMTGHLLGATGVVEAIYTLMAMNDGLIPPTINLDNPDDGTDIIDLVPNKAKEKNIDIAISNSFGFGGTNATIVLKKFK